MLETNWYKAIGMILLWLFIAILTSTTLTAPMSALLGMTIFFLAQE